MRTFYFKQLLLYSGSKWLHLTLLAAAALFISYDSVFPSTSSQTTGYLRLTTQATALHRLFGQDISLIEAQDLRTFYQQRNFKAVWLEQDKPGIDAKYFLKTLKTANADGLMEEYYRTSAIEQHMESTTPLERAQLDIMLSLAYTRYTTHLRIGRLKKELIDEYWPTHPAYIDTFSQLESDLKEHQVVANIYRQYPPHAQYERLRHALKRYREIEKSGGWPRLPNNAVLKPGMHDNRITMLRRRMKISGDLSAESKDLNLYDDELKSSIINYQRRHGILADGIVGASTLKVLNVPVQQRINQLILNMERWRLTPRKLGQRYLMVNTAGFELIAVKNDTPVLQMRVIVGDRSLQTPVLRSDMTHIIFNPSWNVPRKIAVKEIIPKQRENPNYLASNNYQLIQGWGAEERFVDPATVDWTRANDKNFPYQLRQTAGPKNPLGRIKFVLPNEHDVYLHDTPHKILFDNVLRDLSHGCIRLEEPLKLAAFILENDSVWSAQKIQETYDSADTIQANIGDPIPVHLVYFTAWVDDAGQVNFYPDIYDKDTILASMMDIDVNPAVKQTSPYLKTSYQIK